MLPYFRSMKAFFNLSLPKDWQSLSDSQLHPTFTPLKTLFFCFYRIYIYSRISFLSIIS